MLRQQQDEAYLASLRADQEKERKKREERERKRRKEEEVQQQKLAEERRRRVRSLSASGDSQTLSLFKCERKTRVDRIVNDLNSPRRFSIYYIFHKKYFFFKFIKTNIRISIKVM